MEARFAGKLVVVAGGTGALGRAVSLAFLREGAHVAVTYQYPEELEQLKSTAASAAGELDGHSVELTDELAVRRLIDGLLARRGRLHALVNAAGGYSGGAKLWEHEPDVLDRMLALNLRPGYALARAALPAMLEQGHGCIVSVAAKAAFDHPAGAAAYAASKAAVVALMGSLAAEAKGTGVRVNSVVPSIIDTPANRNAMPKADFGKWPKPDDIARVVLFLCSDDARLIHGAAVPVYGDS